MMPLTKGGLAQAVAYLALVLLVIDTRRGLSTPSDPAAEPPGHRALGADAESVDALRGEVAKWAQLQEDGAATTARLSADVEELRRGADLRDEQHRRTQGAEPEPEPEPEIGKNVKLVKVEVVYCTPGDDLGNGGHFDYSQCADRAFASCHAAACAGHTGGGHRRVQAGGDGYGGSCGDAAGHSAQITAECCDEASEDCTGGYPHTCNAGCAAIFLPFWTDCRSALGKDSSQFEPAVALCEAAAPTTAAPSLAEQLNVECSAGTAAADCVPACSQAYHGYLMLLNIEGEDSKLSCELHHGFYSWVGSAVRALSSSRRLCLPSADLCFISILTRYRCSDPDGRRLPGVGLRDLLLVGQLRRRRGVRRDAAGGRGDQHGADGHPRADRQRERRSVSGAGTALGRRWVHGPGARLAVFQLRDDRERPDGVGRSNCQPERLHARCAGQPNGNRGRLPEPGLDGRPCRHAGCDGASAQRCRQHLAADGGDPAGVPRSG